LLHGHSLVVLSSQERHGRKRDVSRQVPGKGWAALQAAKQVETGLLAEVGTGRHQGSRSRTIAN